MALRQNLPKINRRLTHRTFSTGKGIQHSGLMTCVVLLKCLPKKQGCRPQRTIADNLGSYVAARRRIIPAVERRSHKGLNDRAENSHLPLRQRERAIRASRSTGGLQRFAAIYSAVRQALRPSLLPPLRPCQPICTGLMPWQNGTPWPALPPEPSHG